MIHNDMVIDVIEGASVTLFCFSKVKVRWYFQSLDSEVEDHSYNVLRLGNVSFEHSGNYLCYGRYFSDDTPFISQALLRVFGKYNY